MLEININQLFFALDELKQMMLDIDDDIPEIDFSRKMRIKHSGEPVKLVGRPTKMEPYYTVSAVLKNGASVLYSINILGLTVHGYMPEYTVENYV